VSGGRRAITAIAIKTRVRNRVEDPEGGGVMLAQAIGVSDQHADLVRDLRIREVVCVLLVLALVIHPLVDVRDENVDAFVDALPQRL
jgi:hypothetical protein